jgi:hypothetical protein
MHLDLSDDETAALTQELHDIVENDPYPFSPRIRTLRAILGKLKPEPVREPLPPRKVFPLKFIGPKGRARMDEYQLGWQDPIDQLDALRVAVRRLLRRSLGPRERFDRATAPLTKYWRMPERLRNRRNNILNARIAVISHYSSSTEAMFRFDLLSIKELRALEDDIFGLYEACLLDIGRMYSMGGPAAGWYDIMYPKDATSRAVKPRTDPLDNLPPFSGLRVVGDDAEEV